MIRIYLPLFLSLILLSACGSDDDPVIENEEELITELVYTLQPVGGGDEVIMAFSDPDGDGGLNPAIQVNRNLVANTTYEGSITIKNLSDNTTVDVTAEVQAEARDHQFFFVPGQGLNVDLSYLDSDGDGNPVGLRTELRANDPSSGNLVIILRHEPDKSATGVSISDPAGAGGATDIEISFPVSISN
ncbi:hypothetical protein GGR28_001003 [Lewinella aquimaris]|uniref:Type 1 periplasmic binding fold superfamily protein n=1 Tax=Neolewinella aquimaris TaxID=1835722 RepID=A0A840DZQ8_9BACT|nr:type 1 periplasmic binding fold superfamily protein [Neolewinella aquimaris]MBB4078390.1 hypothetical protein [Neolewinella aquimaris]